MKNGVKLFLYVVLHTRSGHNTETYVLRSDHSPDAEEIVEALGLHHDDIHDELSAVRYDEESVPTIPPKAHP